MRSLLIISDFCESCLSSLIWPPHCSSGPFPGPEQGSGPMRSREWRMNDHMLTLMATLSLENSLKGAVYLCGQVFLKGLGHFHGTFFYSSCPKLHGVSFTWNSFNITFSLLKKDIKKLGLSTQGIACDFFLCPSHQEFYDYLPSTSCSLATFACRALIPDTNYLVHMKTRSK